MLGEYCARIRDEPGSLSDDAYVVCEGQTDRQIDSCFVAFGVVIFGEDLEMSGCESG
jgi:hypothetical protein